MVGVVIVERIRGYSHSVFSRACDVNGIVRKHRMGIAQIKGKQWKLSKRAFTVLSFLWVLCGDDFCQNGNDFFYPAKLVEVRNITPRVPMAWPTRTAKRWGPLVHLKVKWSQLSRWFGNISGSDLNH